MSDITQAAEQQALADSLENAPIVGEVVDQQEQPSTEATTEQLEAAEVEQPNTEEEADDYLPTEQEKVFPQDALDRYGKRYGYTPEEIAADPRIQRFLHDKINSDIFIRSQREAEQMQELEPEVEQRQEPTPPQTTQQYLEQLQAKAQQYTNPEVAMAFTNQFLKAFGVNDPATPQMAMEVTKTMTTFGMNLMQTVLQNELQPLIENAFPEFGNMYYRAQLANTWDSIRNSGEQFAELPAYGTKEFKSMTREVAKTIPGFEDLLQSAQSQSGKLSATDAKKFYGILASVAAKQKTTPAEVKQAVQTGKNQANKTAIRKDAANLGAGQSKGQIAQKADRDDIFGEGLEIYKREHGNL